MVKACGWALIGLGLLHMVVLGVDALEEIPGWLRLAQWTTAHWQPFASQPPALAASGGAFWSTIGSFAVPTILLGGLIVDLARRGQHVPGHVGWTLLVWMLLASLIVEPSGFPVGAAVALGLIVGVRRAKALSRG
jgi:hypothetical protein